MKRFNFTQRLVAGWLVCLLFAQALVAPVGAATKYALPNGSNGVAYADNGNGPDTSAANKPYNGLAQSIRTNAAAGDTLILGPGVYRETTVFLIALASLYTIRGDPLNTSGFKDSSGNLVPPGPVILTGRTTSDTTAGAALPTLDLNGIHNVRLEQLFIEGAFGQPGIHCYFSTNVQLAYVTIDCAGNGGYCFDTSVANQVVPYHTFDHTVMRATGSSSANCVSVIFASSSSGADWDSGSWAVDGDWQSDNYTVIGYLRSNGLTKVMGGYALTNMTMAGSYCIATDNSSTTKKWVLRGGFYRGGGQCIANQSTSQIDSDYVHYLYGSSLGGGTVTKGAHDHDSDWSFRRDNGYSRLVKLGDQPEHSLLAGTPQVGGSGNFNATDLYGLSQGSANDMGALGKYVPPGRGY